MSALMRRGACPALAAPMATGDGLLIRLSPVSGGLSPKQLIGLCESAARHGNGIVEVTARGSFQFRGFSQESAGRFAADVNQLGIDVRTGVPVETSPLAGMDPLEVANPLPLAERIRQGISEAGLTDRLGPKVSVVVDGGGQLSLDAIAADVRLVAERHEGTVAWQSAIAGDANRATVLGSFCESDAIALALTCLQEIAAFGSDARAADLVLQGHFERLRSFAPPSVLPDISPARGEMSGRTEGGAKERNSIRGSRHAFILADNRHALSISLPFGQADAETLIALLNAAENQGVTDIRPAPQRTLLLICPAKSAAEALSESAQNLGFITDPTDPRKTIAACPGAPACASDSGKLAARQIAAQLAEALGDHAGLSIHISGCEKGCARQAPADITIVGGENGVGLVVGGTTKAHPLAYRSASGLPRAIAGVAASLRAIRARNGAAALSQADKARLAAAFEQG